MGSYSLDRGLVTSRESLFQLKRCKNEKIRGAAGPWRMPRYARFSSCLTTPVMEFVGGNSIWCLVARGESLPLSAGEIL
jgi:hypothetical protein